MTREVNLSLNFEPRKQGLYELALVIPNPPGKKPLSVKYVRALALKHQDRIRRFLETTPFDVGIPAALGPNGNLKLYPKGHKLAGEPVVMFGEVFKKHMQAGGSAGFLNGDLAVYSKDGKTATALMAYVKVKRNLPALNKGKGVGNPLAVAAMTLLRPVLLWLLKWLGITGLVIAGVKFVLKQINKLFNQLKKPVGDIGKTLMWGFAGYLALDFALSSWRSRKAGGG